MTSSTVRWSVHMPSMGYLCLALALLVHSSRQSPVLDLGYTDDRDLGHSDVRELGYTDVRDRQLHEGSRMKRLLKISKQLQLDKASSSRPAHTERGTKLSNSMVEELTRGVTLLLEALADPPTRRAQTSKNGTTWLKRKAKRDPDRLHAFRDHYLNFYNELMEEFKRIPLDVSDKHTFENYFSPNDPAFDGDIAKVKEKYNKIRIWLAYVLYYVKLKPEFDAQKETIREIIEQMDEKYKQLMQGNERSGRTGEVLPAGVGGTNTGSDFQQLDRVLAERKVDNIYNQIYGTG